MPLIAYSREMLLYNPNTIEAHEKSKFIIQEVSDKTFALLKNLPSKAFELGTNVRDLVEGILREETVQKVG